MVILYESKDTEADSHWTADSDPQTRFVVVVLTCGSVPHASLQLEKRQLPSSTGDVPYAHPWGWGNRRRGRFEAVNELVFTCKSET